MHDTRGVVLPLAVVSLLLFTSLALALIAVAQSEPTIAANHLHAAQARALAESGLAHALWALTEHGDVAAAGHALAVGSTGAFELSVSAADPHVRVVRAVGRTARARAAIVATLVRVRDLARDAPCALCIGAPVRLAASVSDARDSGTSDCGPKIGVTSAGTVAFDAASTAYGAGAPAGTPPRLEGRDWQAGIPLGAGFAPSDLQTLKALAVQRGRYIRPASDAAVQVTDDGGGLVFVDTPAGTPTVTAGNVANVTLGAAPFRGWLVVNGNVALAPGANFAGMVYAVNAVSTEGAVTVTGMVVAQHTLGGESSLSGLGLRFDCDRARAAGILPRGWFVRPGTYCDGTAGC